jgi:alpha-tubulin suppressor-like RCC1 family protein
MRNRRPIRAFIKSTVSRQQALVRIVGATAIALGVTVAVPTTSSAASTGQVYAFGANSYGELGVVSTGPQTCGTISCSDTPVLSAGLPSTVAAIAAGARHSLALMSDGTVQAWGRNQVGELGNGNTTNRSTASAVLTSTVGPVKLGSVTAVDGNAPPITSTSLSGDGHSLALRSDDTVWAWGNNTSGEQGVNPALGSLDTCGTTTPCSKVARQVPGISGVTDISAGATFNLVRKSDGSVWAWGHNASGELGVASTGETCGTAATPCSWTPVQVTGLGAGSGVVQVAAGNAFAMALKSDGTVLAWGNNNAGELGNGTTTASSTPVTVFGPGSGVVQIAAGGAFALARKSDGSLWSWGDNASGELGNGTTTGPSTCGSSAVACGKSPAGVLGLGAGSSISSITAGFSHAIAVMSSGALMVWGDDNSGQLGDGMSGVAEPTPKLLSGITGALGVSAGGSHTLVLLGGLPGPPIIGTAIAGNGQATVNWTAPNTSGGSPISGYQVTPFVGTLAQPPQVFNSTATSEPVTGLTNNTTYTFRVAAINSSGTGPSSAASNSVVPNTGPVVSRVTPNVVSVSGGGVVTISGSNFLKVTAVNIGALPATKYTVVSSLSIKATVPAQSAGTVDVTVTTLVGTSPVATTDHLNYVVPSVTSISPTFGPANKSTSVTLVGVAMGGATAVHFGSVAAVSFKIYSGAKIIAVAPPQPAGSVGVTVTTAAGVTAVGPLDTFTYRPTSVTKVSPVSGTTGGGTAVLITGKYFLGATAVTFGGVEASSFSIVSATSINAISPMHAAGTVDIEVTGPSGTSVPVTADHYTYVTPAVTGVSPTSGPAAGGTTVTITGVLLRGATAVTFGGTPAASFTVVSATSITAVSPSGAVGSVDVRVTTSAGQTAVTPADQFKYL